MYCRRKIDSHACQSQKSLQQLSPLKVVDDFTSGGTESQEPIRNFNKPFTECKHCKMVFKDCQICNYESESQEPTETSEFVKECKAVITKDEEIKQLQAKLEAVEKANEKLRKS